MPKPPFPILEIIGDRLPVLHIVDVGAMYMGPEYVPYSSILAPGRTVVTGFEPLQAECDRLNAAAEPGHRYLPYCIADGTERTFYITNSGFTSSLLEPNTPLLSAFNNLEELTRVERSERVQTRRLDDVSEITDIHYLKLDVQGAELEVLQNASRLLANTMVVFTEVEFLEMYKGQPLFGEIHSYMRSRGFMLHFLNGVGGRGFKPVTANNDINHPVRQALWSDAIFVPDFRRLHLYPPERLIALAYLLHELYQSVDLVAVVLNHYDRKVGTDLWTSYLVRLTRCNPGPRPPLVGVDL